MSNLSWPALEPDIYGPIVSAADVRDAVKSTIDTWSPAYIAVLAYRTGNPLKAFATYEATFDQRSLPADGSASYWVTIPSTADVELRSDGYVAAWVAEVQIVTYGPDWQSTEDYCHQYGAAVRALLVQHPGLGGVGEATEVSTRWLRERYTPKEKLSRHTVGIHQAQYRIKVIGTVDPTAGPRVVPTPPATPEGTYPPGFPTSPLANSFNFTITKTGVD